MKTVTLIVFIMVSATTFAQQSDKLSKQIIALEKAALERWNNGDVYGYLELYADEVGYFDPFLDKRVDGQKKLEEIYKPFQGKLKATSYEFINPKVLAVDNMAVLSFNLNSYEGEKVFKWNCTEVYKKENDGSWKIIQSHWSFTKP